MQKERGRGERSERGQKKGLNSLAAAAAAGERTPPPEIANTTRNKGSLTWIWWGSMRNGSSASIETTHGDSVVAKFLPVNGPSGTYSHFCAGGLEGRREEGGG